MIVPSLALNKEQIAMLKDIPAGTRALLVNFANHTCMHTITCIYNVDESCVEIRSNDEVAGHIISTWQRPAARCTNII